MKADAIFATKQKFRLLGFEREEFTKRDTGEVIRFNRLVVVGENDSGPLAGDLTCGDGAIPAGGLKKGSEYLFHLVPKSRNGMVNVSVREIHEITKA